MPITSSPPSFSQVRIGIRTPPTAAPKAKSAVRETAPKISAIATFEVKVVSGRSGVARRSLFQPRPRSAAMATPNEKIATDMTE